MREDVIERARKDAEKYVVISKNTPVTIGRVDERIEQEVKPSLKEIPILERKPRMPSPRENLQAYLKSIGMP